MNSVIINSIKNKCGHQTDNNNYMPALYLKYFNIISGQAILNLVSNRAIQLISVITFQYSGFIEYLNH